MLASPGLGEESRERVVTAIVNLSFLHGTISIDSMLKAIKLPAVVSNLDTGLAQMDRDTL
jgi:hypothetical protein